MGFMDLRPPAYIGYVPVSTGGAALGWGNISTCHQAVQPCLGTNAAFTMRLDFLLQGVQPHFVAGPAYGSSAYFGGVCARRCQCSCSAGQTLLHIRIYYRRQFCCSCSSCQAPQCTHPYMLQANRQCSQCMSALCERRRQGSYSKLQCSQHMLSA